MHKIINASYSAHFDDYDLLLAAAAAAPGTGLELSIYSPWHKPEFMANQQAQKARFAGLPLTFHGPFEDICAASEPGSLGRKQFVDSWKYAFDVYEEFGAESIVLHTHKVRDIQPADMETLRGYVTDTIQEVAKIAIGRGVCLTVENVGHWVKNNELFNEEQYIALFDQLPKEIGSLIDVGHALINRWDITHVIHTLGERIFSYHLHNNNGCGDTHRPLFEAGNRYTEAEMKQLLLTTNRCSPNADWILEYRFGDQVTAEFLAHDMAVLAELNGK